jgi:hypothetical protein
LNKIFSGFFVIAGLDPAIHAAGGGTTAQINPAEA